MVPETSYADGHSTIITADMPDNHAYDADGTVWEFTGYRLDYANGPWMYVEARDEICLYTDATLTAQWKDVTDQYTTPVPPSVTIVGDSASKEFDGAQLSAQHYSITAGDLGGYTVTYPTTLEPDNNILCRFQENFADLAPSPVLVALEYSHPTLSQRVAAIQAHAGKAAQ